MNKPATGSMKCLAVIGYNYHHVRGHGDHRRFRMLRTKRSIKCGRTPCHAANRNQRGRGNSYHPAPGAASRGGHLLFQSAAQASAETHRHFQQALVAIKLDHVAGPIQHRSAMLAVTEMFFHGRSQGWVYFLFNVVRNLAPHFLAGYYHGFFPFAKLNRLFQLPPSPGASKSRNMRRARNKRVFTPATGVSRRLALSSILRCCTSRSTKTSRYFFPRDASASRSFSRISFLSAVSDGISRQSAKSRGV